MKGIDIPDHTFQKVDSYCHLVVDREHALAVALDQGGLSDGTVAHDHDLRREGKVSGFGVGS